MKRVTFNIITKKIIIISIVITNIGCSNVFTSKLKKKENLDYTLKEPVYLEKKEKKELTKKQKEEFSFLRGVNYSQNGEYFLALKELENAHKENSENIFVLQELGYVLLQLNRLEEGIKCYKKVLILDTNNILAMKNLGYIYYQKKEYKLSKEYLIKIPPSLEDDFIKKLNAYIEVDIENWDKAEHYFEKIIDSEYENELYEKYTLTLIKLDKREKLFKFINKKYEKYHLNPQYLIFYTKTLENYFEEFELSEKILKRYLAIQGVSEEIIGVLIENLKKQNKNEEIKTILKLCPSKVKYKEKK